MISKGITFQPRFAIGSNEPTVAFLDGKIVYSKYVVFGTTYNTQNFTFPYAIHQNNVDVPHDWHVEVLGIAGTDPDNGDYYYCGLLNDGQDVESYQDPQSIISYFTGDGFQTTKIRDILWVIPFSDFIPAIAAIWGRVNTYLASVDFSKVRPFWRGNDVANAFYGCSSLQQLIEIGPALEAFLSDYTQNNFLCNNFIQAGNAPLVEVDFRGFTQWYKVGTNQGTIISNCKNVERIYFSEASQDCDNYVNASFYGLPKLADLDLAKLRWNKLSVFKLDGNYALETITLPSSIKLKTGAILDYAFADCYKLQSDPHIELWTGEDGTSKPTVQSSHRSIINYCGRDVPITDRTWYFDFSGWSFICNSSDLFYISILNQSNGNKVKFDNFHLLPYGTHTTIILALRLGLGNLSPDTCLTTSVDFDSATDVNITNRYIGLQGLYQFLYNNTVTTTVRLGTFEAYSQDGEIASYALSDVFKSSVVSSIDLLAKHINFYRQQTVVDQGQSTTQTNINPLIVGDAVNWTNSTQINDFVDSLVATQSKQFQMNNIKLQIQFNAEQRDIIQARATWGTDITTIEANGWEIIFPVMTENGWSNINMSEL